MWYLKTLTRKMGPQIQVSMAGSVTDFSEILVCRYFRYENYAHGKSHSLTSKLGITYCRLYRKTKLDFWQWQWIIPILRSSCCLGWDLSAWTEGVSFKSSSLKSPLEPFDFDAGRSVYFQVESAFAMSLASWASAGNHNCATVTVTQ